MADETEYCGFQIAVKRFPPGYVASVRLGMTVDWMSETEPDEQAAFEKAKQWIDATLNQAASEQKTYEH